MKLLRAREIKTPRWLDGALCDIISCDTKFDDDRQWLLKAVPASRGPVEVQSKGKDRSEGVSRRARCHTSHYPYVVVNVLLSNESIPRGEARLAHTFGCFLLGSDHRNIHEESQVFAFRVT